MTGSMPLARREFLFAIRKVWAIRSQWFHGNNLRLHLNKALLFWIELTVPRNHNYKQPALHKNLQKSCCFAACKKWEFVDKSSRNRGNFLEFLNPVAKHDTVIQQKITNTPQNATYLSPHIQNDLLHKLAGIV